MPRLAGGDGEIRFQRRGYAAAITDPHISRAINTGYLRRIAVTYVEWGDADSQEVVVPWTIIDGPESAAAFAAKLLEEPRRAFGPNAIGNALAAAHGLIESNAIEGLRQVIDFSGDSAYNFGGISILEARSAALAADIVINGLAILCRVCDGRPVGYDLEAGGLRAQSVIGALPRRGWGRPPSATAMQTTISSGRGASATKTVMVSK